MSKHQIWSEYVPGRRAPWSSCGVWIQSWELWLHRWVTVSNPAPSRHDVQLWPSATETVQELMRSSARKASSSKDEEEERAVKDHCSELGAIVLKCLWVMISEWLNHVRLAEESYSLYLGGPLLASLLPSALTVLRVMFKKDNIEKNPWGY